MKAKHLFAAAMTALLAATGAQASLEISKKPTQSINCSDGVCTATAEHAVFNVGELASMLAVEDITIKSTSLAKSIEIDAMLRWASTSHLTLEGNDFIKVSKPVEIKKAGRLTITTIGSGKDGDLRFSGEGHVEFQKPGGRLVINHRHYPLVRSISQMRKLMRHAPFLALAQSFDASRDGTYANPIFRSGTGVFEGLGNTIRNLKITARSGESVGFLPYIGKVLDFGLINIDIEADSSTCVGAIVPTNEGVISNSYATGHISAGANSVVGGLACGNFFQYSKGIVVRSHADVDISAGENSVVGGLLGDNVATCVAGCRFNGYIDQSYALGAVSGGDGAMVGGLVGKNYGGAISYSYATGTATAGNNSFVGGLVGENADLVDEAAIPVIAESYSTGFVTGGSGAMVGGLIGQDAADSKNTSTYWDLNSSGVSNPAQGAGNIQSDPGITGLTSEQFISGLPPGFNKHWREKTKINYGYPYLIGNPPLQ